MARRDEEWWSYLPPSISPNERGNRCASPSKVRVRVGGDMEKVMVAGTDVKLLLALYRKMVQLREFELKVQDLYRRGMLPGFVHLYVGEEAVATGVCAHLAPQDLVYSTHRGHGH